MTRSRVFKIIGATAGVLVVGAGITLVVARLARSHYDVGGELSTTDQIPTPSEHLLIEQVRTNGWPTHGPGFLFGTDHGRPYVQMVVDGHTVRIEATAIGGQYYIASYTGKVQTDHGYNTLYESFLETIDAV